MEALKENNLELEQVSVGFGETNIEYFLLEKPLLKEFNEPFYTIIIANCPKKMTMFSLILRNMGDNTPSAATVSLYRGRTQIPLVGKG